MRLLKSNGQSSFSLTEFTGSEIPSYAILSHTWGTDGDEVTYQDLKFVSDEKAGYEKLRFCAQQAASDGLEYFWVDTCCIDKSNQVELQHAINSMFRWYQDAVKCYVYLSDVHRTENNLSQASWEAAFRTSRWFTRSWTLQELLAPKSVEFFSKESIRLGDKKSLEQQIHEITEIPIEALQGRPLSEFTVDERMSWVGNREAKYEEDKVYSLQGIFDVHIPLIYGEGQKRALIRLHKEIQESSESLPVFTKSDAPFIVPFDRNTNFTGRESQLMTLEEKFSERGQTTKLAIVGLGGVGKTQLLLELVYRIRDTHKTCAIIWIPATNMESLHQAYLDVAQKLGIVGWEDDKADAKRLVQDYLSKEHAGEWLLVFDNADNIDMWIAKPALERESSRLLDYLPRSKQGCIFFTTRNRKVAVKLAKNNIIEVPEMDENMAIQLVQKSLIDPDLVNNRADTKALLEQLTYLPLAIIQAAAYINENKIPFAEYLALLADQEEDVIDLLSEEFEDDGRYQDVKNPIATTWLISFKQIRACDPFAADYLSFMACIEPKDIPQSLLPPGTSRKKEIDAIGTLDAYSFITKRSDGLALDLHRLVHLAMRNWLREEKLLAQSTEKVILRLEEVFPDEDPKNRSVWRTYLPHTHYILGSDLVNKDWQSRVNLLWRYGMCLYADGRWNETEDLDVQVIETRKRVLGAEHPDTLTSMANLASTFWNQGRWKEAEDLNVQVMETRKRVLGAEHPDTLTSIANLALTFWNQGRWKEAEDLNVQVIETRKRVLGAEHPNTLTSIANLASTFWNQGRWKEAEDLDVQVMETSSRVLGAEHPDTMTSIANLASTYRDQGRWKEAEDLNVQVIETRKRVLGAEHPNTLTSIANLASTYRNQGRWKEAEDLDVQVMETSSRVLGAEHPDTLTSIANLASTYRNQGRWKEAEDLDVQVMETSSRVLGAEHPDTLTSIANLASTYRNQGRWKEAEDLEVQVMETSSRVLGAEHPNTLTSRANLASTFLNQGRWKEAEDLDVQVMETSSRVLGAEHPDTLTSMANLASIYRDQGRWKEAEQLQAEELEICSRVVGAEHPDTLTSMANLAFTWKGQAKVKEALELMEQCVRSRKIRLGVNHPDTQSSLETLTRWREGSGLESLCI